MIVRSRVDWVSNLRAVCSLSFDRSSDCQLAGEWKNRYVRVIISRYRWWWIFRWRLTTPYRKKCLFMHDRVTSSYYTWSANLLSLAKEDHLIFSLQLYDTIRVYYLAVREFQRNHFLSRILLLWHGEIARDEAPWPWFPWKPSRPCRTIVWQLGEAKRWGGWIRMPAIQGRVFVLSVASILLRRFSFSLSLSLSLSFFFVSSPSFLFSAGNQRVRTRAGTATAPWRLCREGARQLRIEKHVPAGKGVEEGAVIRDSMDFWG